MIEILHVSDLHFRRNPSQNQKAKALLDAISEQHPVTGRDNRYLLVTGDITESGEEKEYGRAGQSLSRFAGRVLVTPGNHDYGLFGMDYSEEKAKYFDHPFAKELKFEHPFIDKNVFVKTLQDQSDHSTLMIIGLNSCAKMGVCDFAQGEVGPDQRDELGDILAQCDPQVPKLLFLHHIPNKEAEWPWLLTLRDWSELMAVVGGKVDVLAFGHQGTLMQPEGEGKYSLLPAPSRPMLLRSIVVDSKRTWVLDANNSVAEKACYFITSDGTQTTAKVKYFAKGKSSARGKQLGPTCATPIRQRTKVLAARCE